MGSKASTTPHEYDGTKSELHESHVTSQVVVDSEHTTQTGSRSYSEARSVIFSLRGCVYYFYLYLNVFIDGNGVLDVGDDEHAGPWRCVGAATS